MGGPYISGCVCVGVVDYSYMKVKVHLGILSASKLIGYHRSG